MIGRIEIKLILLNNVCKTYKNKEIGLDNISLEINEGEFVFLVGQSGAGKSTLLKLITGEEKPTSGEICVFDLILNNLGRKELPYYRRLLGIIDSNLSLLDYKTVYQNIELALIATEQPNKNINDSINRVLGIVGMTKKMYDYPTELSGGEKLKIQIARALINNPKIILADEPTASLDNDTAWDIMCLFNDLNKLGTTIIISTHAKEFVNIMKKRVVTINNGKILGDVNKGKYGWLL